MSGEEKRGGNKMQITYSPFIVPSGTRPKKTTASKKNSITSNFIKNSMKISPDGKITFDSSLKKK